ncbi:MAG: DUF5329 domain-containing protein [Deltaproteobacteria bacterium]|jgi:hypothetical protein|nr:DUF5329 domain-containing protein [Deltaproteobacteria bacterium]
MKTRYPIVTFKKCSVLVLVVTIWLAASSGVVFALDEVETDKVEKLLSDMSEDRHIIFIRNNKGYPVDRAVAHLRSKLRQAGHKVNTVEEFIDNLASKSSISGAPYLVHYPDGRQENSRDYFYRLLARQKQAKTNR